MADCCASKFIVVCLGVYILRPFPCERTHSLFCRSFGIGVYPISSQLAVTSTCNHLHYVVRRTSCCFHYMLCRHDDLCDVSIYPKTIGNESRVSAKYATAEVYLTRDMTTHPSHRSFLPPRHQTSLLFPLPPPLRSVPTPIFYKTASFYRT